MPSGPFDRIVGVRIGVATGAVLVAVVGRAVGATGPVGNRE